MYQYQSRMGIWRQMHSPIFTCLVTRVFVSRSWVGASTYESWSLTNFGQLPKRAGVPQLLVYCWGTCEGERSPEGGLGATKEVEKQIAWKVEKRFKHGGQRGEETGEGYSDTLADSGEGNHSLKKEGQRGCQAGLRIDAERWRLVFQGTKTFDSGQEISTPKNARCFGMLVID